MKDFKNSTKMRSGFRFPSSAGFSGSTGKTQNISYTRRTPHRKKFAEGGQAKVPCRPPDKPVGGLLENLRKTLVPPKTPDRTSTIDSQVDRMSRRRGGKIMRKADGGRVRDSALQGPNISSALDQEAGPRSPLRPGYTRGGYAAKYAKGGRIPESKMRKIAHSVVGEHVARPAPKGHKGLKSC